ncbi:NfeD family protein [Flammeovirgaceae bacterium SG7u.111]|nr:NfeD family protein [Flammeovirgaceae bacterium SG7u.132]WPO38490.1 NfeD family protein [Flammeovirgaceae bacterium SG7u.111]
MLETIAILGLIIFIVAFFGLRKILFGENSLLKNREDIRALITGGSLTTDIDKAEGLVGMTGKAQTVLRPVGKVLVGDNLYEAATGGEFIDKGKKIKVMGKSMGTLKVREIEE